jgi:hypothetical protein
LRTRLGVKDKSGTLSSRDIPAVYRTILSSFVDHPFIKSGTLYVDRDEERELDKTSILYQQPPDAVVGMPFDLVVERENRRTAEKEKFRLSLITFASEISPDVLQQLKPFSYRKEENIAIEDNKLIIRNRAFYGGRLIFDHTGRPDWQDRGQRDILLRTISRWMRDNRQQLKFMPRWQNIRDRYREALEILSKQKQSATSDRFDQARDTFLVDEMSRHLHTDDLKLFFDLHIPFFKLTLKDLMPPSMIEGLKRRQWPKKIALAGKLRPLVYVKGKPSVRMDFSTFEQIERDDLTLPTGEECGILFGRHRIPDWDTAVRHFNRWKKQDVFEKKWKNDRKQPRMVDIAEIPFPQPFHSGQDKNNQPFEFYTVPDFQAGVVTLIHFPNRDAALAHYQKIETEWMARVQQFKKGRLDSIFKAKGWKVR